VLPINIPVNCFFTEWMMIGLIDTARRKAIINMTSNKRLMILIKIKGTVLISLRFSRNLARVNYSAINDKINNKGESPIKT